MRRTNPLIFVKLVTAERMFRALQSVPGQHASELKRWGFFAQCGDRELSVWEPLCPGAVLEHSNLARKLLSTYDPVYAFWAHLRDKLIVAGILVEALWATGLIQGKVTRRARKTYRALRAQVAPGVQQQQQTPQPTGVENEWVRILRSRGR